MGFFSAILNIVFMILGVEPTQKFPRALTKQEEEELFLKSKKGDMKARDKLIEHNLRLVAHIVRKYYVSCKNQEDLISVGTIGLIKAIDSFNCSNGARFATYAAKCIQNEILMLFRSQKKLGYEVSLSDTIDIDKDGNPLTYIDIVYTEDTIADDIDKKMKINKALEYIRDNLDDREKQIIIMRYGLGNTKAYTQREVAQKLDISRSYVSRIEKSVLEKINKYLTCDS
jgi:RNA polymerase sporulation-specific sigma factor